MASKPDNKAAGGGSPTHKSQEQFLSLQTQSQRQDIDFKDLKEFIIVALMKQDAVMDQKFEKFQQEIKEVVQEKYDKMKQDILTVLTGFSEVIVQIDKKVEEISLEVESKMKEADYKIYNVDNKMQRIENEVTMMQFKFMEFAVRLRGIKENNRDLRRVCADALVVMLKVSPEEVLSKIDKIYRVNSWVARQRQLPRDVVIYFTDRRIRNDILQKFFVSTLQVDGREIAIYKELPPKMLKDRKDFGFLVTELKKQQIPFRWDVPIGIILRYQGEKYRLNTVEKAEEFYLNVFKIGPTSPRTSSVLGIQEGDKEKQIERETEVQWKQMEMEPMEIQGTIGGFLDEPFLDLPLKVIGGPPKNTREVALDLDLMSYKVKDQRITLSAYKQIPEKQQQQRSKPVQGKKRSRFHKTRKF